MKLKLITSRNQCNPFNKKRILMLKLKDRVLFIGWSFRWSTPHETEGGWRWTRRPIFGWGVIK